MAKEVRAGKAYVELGLRERLEQGLKSARRKLDAFGRTAIVSGAAGFAGAAAILTPIISAASEAQEVASKFATVFGANTDAVREWGNEYAEAVGRSRTQIEQFMAGSQDLFVPLGFDDATATDLSKTLTTLSVDLASFNNKADADVLNDLQAAMTGSGEVMKKYGVILSEAATKQELVNQGLDPKAATNAQKVQARLNIVLAGTTAAQGDAARTAGSFANQSKRLWAMLDNVAGSLGELILPAATHVLGVINQLVGATFNFVQENKMLVTTILAAVGAVGAIGASLMALGGTAIAGSFLIGLLTSGFVLVKGAILALAGPIGIGIALIAAIGTVAWLNRERIIGWAMAFWDAIAPIRQALERIWGTVSETAGKVREAFAAGGLSAAAEAAWLGVQAVFFTAMAELGRGLDWLYDRASDIFGRIREAAINGLTQFAAPVLPVVQSVLSAFDFLLASVKETAGGVADALMSGDFALAGQILWVTLEGIWVAGTNRLKFIWAAVSEGFAEVFDSVRSGIARGFRTMVQTISDLMQSLLEKGAKAWAFAAEFDPTGQAKKVAAGLETVAGIYGRSSDIIAKMQDDADAAQAKRRIDRANVTNAKIQDADQRAADVKARRDELLARASRQRNGRTLDQMAADRQIQIDELVARAKSAESVVEQEKVDEVEKQQQEGLGRGDRTVRTAGTFSAVGAALLGLGGSNAQEKTAANTGRMARTLDQIADREPAAPQFS